MDTDALVEFQIDAGQRLVVQLLRDGFSVQAAFWLKTAEEGVWFLYIASPVVDEKGLAAAYRALQSSHQRLQALPLSLADIKLIGTGNPIASDVLAMFGRFPGAIATRFGGKQLGGMSIEEAYMYPAYLFSAQGSGPMTQDEVLREVINLMNRGQGSVPASKVILKDGSTFTGVPFSVQWASQRPLVVQFVAEGELAPRVLGIDEIASIK